MIKLITVVTPTYNRRKTIYRVFESLNRQTIKDFEWIIIDDGSKDNTKELIREFQELSLFPIRYIFQQNSGKFSALQKGIIEAKGELFLIADSDDEFTSTTIEFFIDKYSKLCDEDKERVFGIGVLCKDSSTGLIVGDMYPSSPMLSTPLEMDMRYRISGEKWGVLVTDKVRDTILSVPNSTEIKFLSENYFWYQLSQFGKMVYYNEILRIYYTNSSNSLANTSFTVEKHPLGSYIYHREVNKYILKYILIRPLFVFLNILRYIYSYIRCSKTYNLKYFYYKDFFYNSLLFFMYPLGVAYSLWKKWKYNTYKL